MGQLPAHNESSRAELTVNDNLLHFLAEIWTSFFSHLFRLATIYEYTRLMCWPGGELVSRAAPCLLRLDLTQLERRSSGEADARAAESPIVSWSRKSGDPKRRQGLECGEYGEGKLRRSRKPGSGPPAV